MATPRPTSYSVASGAGVYAGIAGPLAALALIAPAPEESWVQLNAGKNQFQDVFPPEDLRPMFGVSPSQCAGTLTCWPSFALNDVGGELYAWGGGHANQSDASFYKWSYATLNWSRVYVSPEMENLTSINSNVWRAVDNITQASSHTYGNNNYLPIIGRFFSFGGAAYNTGGALAVYSSDGLTNLRPLGGFSVDMTLGGEFKLAGATGSNVKRGAYTGVNLEGANAVTLHDWFGRADWTQTPSTGTGGATRWFDHTETGTAYRVVGGKDALLYTARSTGGGGRSIWQVVFNDTNQANDSFTRLSGVDGDASSGQGAIAHSPTHDLVLTPLLGQSSGEYLRFVDLKLGTGGSNTWQTPTLSGADLTEFQALNLRDMGIVWNTVKGCFTLWAYGKQVWEVYPPSGNPTPTTGWSLVKPTMNAAAGPPAKVTSGALTETGIIGAFRWSARLNGPLTALGGNAGAVWFYKSTGWTAP
jgi:hypothetical protein